MKNQQEKSRESDTQRWSEVIVNIVLSLLLVVAVALALSVVERVFESRVAAAKTAGVPVWHAFVGLKTAEAAPLKGYEALLVSTSGGNLTMAPGESKTVSVNFLNIGTAEWLSSGSNFVSVYTYEPKYRTSVFADPSWYKINQPALISEAKVAVKGNGTISLKLKAPTTVGTYKETFALAVEDKAWIPGGQFTITIKVAEQTVSSTSVVPSTSSVSSTTTDGYSATVLLKSIKKTLQVKGGEVVTFTAGIKNSGSQTWNARSIKLPEISTASSVSYVDSSWADSKTAIVKNDSPVVPGAMDLITFKFKAPVKKGNYTVKFAMAADNVDVVTGSEIEIPIEVTSDAPEVKDFPVIVEDTISYIEEPVIRVGVLIVDEETEDQVKITCASDFNLKDGNNSLLAEMKAGEEVEAFYKKGKYWFNRGKGLESTSFFIRFEPVTANAICTVTNFDRRISRNAANADNQFRNILEIHYNVPNDRTWLINELPMEYYLRGLGETSDLSNLEFQKALLTAARTYALYHWERATKHASEFFHVDAYADQVYFGYGQEARTPHITEAVEATRGQVVIHGGATAITPYFSRSDGRTRSWNEVWGGRVPWCVSVSTPHDVGKTLWGHGVGMSASEALAMGKEGTDWQTIIKYFYTGIDLVKRWK